MTTTSKREDISPAIATKWLEQNTMNRRVKLWWVDYLAKEMSEGRWQDNGDSIVFDSEGNLADGQHRLLAAIKADYRFNTVVVRGIKPEARLTIDDPMKRSFADDLVMNSQGANAPAKETLLRRIIQWNAYHGLAEVGHVRTGRARLAEAYPTFAAELGPAIAVSSRHNRVPATNSAVAFVAWLLAHNTESAEELDRFFSILAIGSQDKRDYTLVKLRDKLIRIDEEKHLWHTKGKTAMQVWLMIKGWNSWITGKAEAYAAPRGGKLLNPFPMPVKVIRGE